jgi:hypothetical protein
MNWPLDLALPLTSHFNLGIGRMFVACRHESMFVSMDDFSINLHLLGRLGKPSITPKAGAKYEPLFNEPAIGFGFATHLPFQPWHK